MNETIKVPPEQLPPTRKVVDKAIGIGNVVDGITIVGGIIFTSAALVGLGVAGLVGSSYVRENHVRRMPKEKVTGDKIPKSKTLFRFRRKGA